MPFKGFRRRSSSEASSSASSAATTPNSLTQPSPLELAVACPSIIEHPFDDDDNVPNAPGEAEAFDGVGDTSGSRIEIGDEQIDLNPFDPSISDELRVQEQQRLRAAAEAAAKGQHSPSSFPERVRRAFGSSGSSASKTPRKSSVTSNRSGGSPSSPPAPWRMSLRRRCSSLADAPLLEDDEDDGLPNTTSQGIDHSSNKRGVVQDPGVVLMHASRAGTPDKWGLVPLAQAQSREDIVRRPEGYEM